MGGAFHSVSLRLMTRQIQSIKNIAAHSRAAAEREPTCKLLDRWKHARFPRKTIAQRSPFQCRPCSQSSELADYLQVSTATVYRLMRDGVLVGVRIGSSLRFTQKNIEDLLENCAIDADL